MATITPEITRKERTTPNYRQQIKRALSDHAFKPSRSNLWWLPAHFAFIAGCWYLLYAQFTWWFVPFITIAIGHSMACTAFVAHDVGHGGAHKGLFWRDLFCGIGFSAFWISPRLWRRWHNDDHHGHTQVEGVDPDHLFTMEEYEKNPILRGLYKLSPFLRNIVIFSSFTYRMNQQQLRMVFVYLKSKKPSTWEKVVIVSQLMFMAGAWITLASLLGSTVVIWGYFVPLMVANSIVISYIATNHFLNPLADESDVLATSLSVTLPRWLKWLDPMHQYFGAHVAHHLFPQAPAHSARLIEQKTAELFPDRFHSMPMWTALVMLWRTPWIYEGQNTLVDPQRKRRIPTLGNGLERFRLWRKKK